MNFKKLLTAILILGLAQSIYFSVRCEGTPGKVVTPVVTQVAKKAGSSIFSFANKALTIDFGKLYNAASNHSFIFAGIAVVSVGLPVIIRAWWQSSYREYAEKATDLNNLIREDLSLHKANQPLKNEKTVGDTLSTEKCFKKVMLENLILKFYNACKGNGSTKTPDELSSSISRYLFSPWAFIS